VKKTPLHACHVEAGARMVEFAGWEMPVQYSGVVDEHRAVREAVGLFDVSHMGEIELSGGGAEAVCRRLFANDVSKLKPGRAQYSLIPNDEGGVVDDIIVYRLAAERFLVCVNASNADKDLAWICDRAAGDCSVVDRGGEYALIAVQGPKAVELVSKLAPSAAQLARFGCEEVEIEAAGGDLCVIARTGYTGEDGFELFVPASRAAQLWNKLLADGEGLGVRPIGLGARDTLRLEAALPLYGHELNDSISPFEAGLAWVVKLNRPDMTGFKALERSKAQPARILMGLEIDKGIAREGCSVLASGVRIGVVTSGTHSPTLGRPVAIALVDRDAATDDLAVDVRGKPRPARVTDLPFYVRDASGG
jgi:aminomethyltransferase